MTLLTVGETEDEKCRVTPNWHMSLGIYCMQAFCKVLGHGAMASLSRQVGVDRKAMHHMDPHMLLVLRSECFLITRLPSVIHAKALCMLTLTFLTALSLPQINYRLKDDRGTWAWSCGLEKYCCAILCFGSTLPPPFCFPRNGFTSLFVLPSQMNSRNLYRFAHDEYNGNWSLHSFFLGTGQTVRML